MVADLVGSGTIACVICGNVGRAGRSEGPGATAGFEGHASQLPGCGPAGLQAGGDRGLVARQLRRTRATAIRKAFGLEAAKAVLGHTDTKITEIYAERDLELARRVMGEIG
jgi:hypothetical protein